MAIPEDFRPHGGCAGQRFKGFLRPFTALLVFVCMALALAGCATLPRDAVHHPSGALLDSSGTGLDRENARLENGWRCV